MAIEGKSCQICAGNIISEASYLDTYGHTLFQDKMMLVCQECGFGQIYPEIEKNKLNDFYENFWRSEASPAFLDFKEWALSKTILDARSLSQLLLGAQYLKNKKEYSFLDIGPGIGWSFISAQHILADVKLFTIELCREAKDYYSKNLDKITIVNNFGELGDKMDVVLMSHSLEHFSIHDIDELFVDIHSILTDNGILIIEVPNEMKMPYRDNHTPHLSFFSLESLQKLVGKFEHKFELCFIDTADMLLSEDSKMSELSFKSNTRGKFITRVRSFVKKAIVASGLYGSFRLIKQIKNIDKIFNASGFKYGGDREMIRCVLRKRA